LGGIPAWLLADPELRVRTSDRRFLEASRKYLAEVGKRLAPLEIGKGGNIIMVQVENEYGSFGEDKVYLHAVKKMIQDAGFDGQLFTADGSRDYMLRNGTVPGVLAVINFGVDDAPGIAGVAKEFENLARFRQNVPRMTGEYWIGWFDHWGEKHHTVKPELAAEGLRWMLMNNISFNLYMFHGGTTFGFMNGANYSRKEPYQPDTSSYDYDAPLDEGGRPTPKYYALREVIKSFLPEGEILPAVPASADLIEIPAFDLSETADFFTLLGKPVASEKVVSMEELGQNYGFMLYRKKLEKDAQGELKIEGVRDYALVFNNGTLSGRLDRRLNESTLVINAKAGATLDVLVENGGRLNFGKDFILDRKGIVGEVSLDGESLKDWQLYTLPLDDLSGLKFKKEPPKQNSPVFYRGSFKLRTVGDTFLDTTTWGKGHVWINGHHLGRFWRIGPQQTLYVPASWLKKGKNEVMVLEVDTPRRTTLRGLKSQIFANQ
jgi:beta-galactosidase